MEKASGKQSEGRAKGRRGGGERNVKGRRSEREGDTKEIQ